jgi:hypothetical protein
MPADGWTLDAAWDEWVTLVGAVCFQRAVCPLRDQERRLSLLRWVLIWR